MRQIYLLLLTAGILFATNQQAVAQIQKARHQKAGSTYLPPDPSGEPLNPNYQYYQNKGQLFDSEGNQRHDLMYYTNNTSPMLYLAKKSISFVYEQRDTVDITPDSLFRIDLTFSGKGSTTSGPVVVKGGSGYLNYYYEQLPSPIEKIQGNLRMMYPSVFPKVDMHLWSNTMGAKSCFVVHPGGNPDIVEMSFTGQDQLLIDPYFLKLYLTSRELRIPQAIAFQVDANDNVVPLTWSPTFLNMGNGAVRFNIGAYDPAMKLVIQMGVDKVAAPAGADEPAWGTYIGHQSHDAVNDATTDTDGNLFVVGETASAFFPTTTGAVQEDIGVGMDVFIGMFTPEYKSEWITYMGGQQNDFGEGITYNTQNDKIYITGTSNGALPVADLPGAWNQHQSGLNHGSFVGRIRADPNTGGLVEWLSYFGGEGTRSTTITSDANGNVFIGGWTDNPTGVSTCTPVQTPNLDFPVCQTVTGLSYLQQNNAGIRDGFVASFDALSQLKWSTFLGGAGSDVVKDLAVDNTGNFLYVGGVTGSEVADPNGTFDCFAQTNGDFPLCNANGGYFRAAMNGIFSDPADMKREGFISKFSIDDTPDLLWSTYFGGIDHDGVTGIAVSDQGELYVTGFTETDEYVSVANQCLDIWESGFPHCPTGGWTQADFGGGDFDNFVAGFDATNTLTWSSFIGGSDDEANEFGGGFGVPLQWQYTPSIALDDNNNVYVTGTTRSGGSSIPLADEGFYFYQDDKNTVGDGYLTAFSGSHALTYSTYFGGTGGAGGNIGDEPSAVTTHSNNRVYIVGSTNSLASFPLYDPGNDAYYQGATTVSATVADGFMAQLNPREFPLVAEQIESMTSDPSVAVFPNPASDLATIELIGPGAIERIALLDATGRTVQSQVVSATLYARTAQVDLTGLPAGLYLVQTYSGTESYISRLVKH